MYILPPDQNYPPFIKSIYLQIVFSLKKKLILLKIMCINAAVVLNFSWVCFKAMQLGENPCPSSVEEG